MTKAARGVDDLQRFDYEHVGPVTFEQWCKLTGYTRLRRRYKTRDAKKPGPRPGQDRRG